MFGESRTVTTMIVAGMLLTRLKQQQQQQRITKVNKQTNKQIRIKRLRGPVHMNRIIGPTDLCF